jgi:hypothetical protein
MNIKIIGLWGVMLCSPVNVFVQNVDTFWSATQLVFQYIVPVKAVTNPET